MKEMNSKSSASVAGANIEGTQRFFSRYRHQGKLKSQATVLGKTGLHVSRIGFGGYRVRDDESTHHEALTLALTSGCNLIDTSSNYGDGASERLVGDVLGELIEAKRIQRDEIVIVSKVGYVQGSNLDLAKERLRENRPFAEMVEYHDSCWHCISPDFLSDQITRSLERLGTGCIDVLLLHNPEYFLKSQGDPEEYYGRIKNAFERLESEVEKGRIAYYGISSNTFPAPKDSADYTSLEIVYELSEELARARGKKNHFSVIQFPMNLLEPGASLEENNSGQSVAQYARLKNLGTLVNRPLNAFTEKGVVRLADFPSHESGAESSEDEADLVEGLKTAWNQTMDLEIQFSKIAEEPPVHVQKVAWGHILKHNFQKFQDIDSWKGLLKHQIEPTLVDAFKELRADNRYADWAENYSKTSKRLFEIYQKYLENQASFQSDQISMKLAELNPKLAITPTLSQKVLKLYLSLPGIDTVLVGMRKPEYVQNTMSWNRIQDEDMTDEQGLQENEALRALSNFQLSLNG